MLSFAQPSQSPFSSISFLPFSSSLSPLFLADDTEDSTELNNMAEQAATDGAVPSKKLEEEVDEDDDDDDEEALWEVRANDIEFSKQQKYAVSC